MLSRCRRPLAGRKRFLSLPPVVAMYEFFWVVVEVGISGEPLDTLSVGGWEWVVGLGKLFYT